MSCSTLSGDILTQGSTRLAETLKRYMVYVRTRRDVHRDKAAWEHGYEGVRRPRHSYAVGRGASDNR